MGHIFIRYIIMENLITNAQHIAIRLFFANVNGLEDEAYSFLYECDRPYETYIDDHCQGQSFQPWQPFELRSVGDMQELVDNLASDIIQTMRGNPNEDDAQAVIACPECGSTQFTKKGKETTANGVKQRYKCKDCNKHFYGKIIQEEVVDN